MPTLVLNGDLDTITASSGAREVAGRFPNSTFVDVQNSFHVTAIYDKDDCASRIYVHFVETLSPGNTTCARKIAEPHVVPLFASGLQDIAAAEPAKGDASRPVDRRLAAVAAATVADVLARWWVNYDGASVGLHGGKWSYEGDDPVVFELKAIELIPGVEVTGTARWNVRQGIDHGARHDACGRPDEGGHTCLVVYSSTSCGGNPHRRRRGQAPRCHDARAVDHRGGALATATAPRGQTEAGKELGEDEGGYVLDL